MRFLHFADLHLDTQFLRAEPSAADRRRQNLRDTLQAIVELARNLRADALLCGGDLYDQERFMPDTATFVRTLFERASPLRVFIAPGNHDWYGPRSLYAQGPWSPNVTIFKGERLEPVPLSGRVTLWGAAHRAPAGTPGFLDDFQAPGGGIHLALFHGSEQGSFALAGEGKFPHAPFRREQIEAAGLTHAFVGHYHVAVDGDRFTYPGNPDPLSFGEREDPTRPRGAVLAEIDDDGRVRTERHRVARSQVHDVEVDVTGCATGQDVRERVQAQVAQLRGWVRATFRGELTPEVDLQPRLLSGVAPHLEALVFRFDDVRPAFDIEAIAREQTVRGQFVRDVLAAEMSEEEKRRVLATGLRALSGRRDLEVV